MVGQSILYIVQGVCNCTLKTLKRWVFLTVVLAVTWIVFLFIQSPDLQLQHWTKMRNCTTYKCAHTVSTDTFIDVTGSKTLYFSAFMEHRVPVPSVRILAIVWRDEIQAHYCVLPCEGYFSVVRARKNIHSSHYDFPYGMGDFLCIVPSNCKPNHVALTTSETNYLNNTFLQILNEQPRDTDFPVDITICISTMFNGYNNVLQFVQAMEMYRLLGAQKVVVYKSGCSPDMEEVLRHYQVGMGFIEVLSWPISTYINVSSSWQVSKSPGDLHYHGQIQALHDCVYRNMYTSRYVFLHDADEIILPSQHKNWRDFLDRLTTKYGDTVYYFENNVFPIEESDLDGSYDPKEWSSLPGESFLRHTLREPIALFAPRTGKLIVNPRAVFELNVHHVARCSSRTVSIPSTIGKLYHVRRRKNVQLGRKDLIVDKGLWRWAPQMIREVNNALSKMKLPSQGRHRSP